MKYHEHTDFQELSRSTSCFLLPPRNPTSTGATLDPPHLWRPTAKLFGVWPPTEITTPRGFSNSLMSMTRSLVAEWLGFSGSVGHQLLRLVIKKD